MAKPKSAPTAQAFEVPETPDLMPSYDPFQVAKQFDQLRQGTSVGANPFQMPQIQPKPIEYGGRLPGPARGAPIPGRPSGGAAPAGWANSDWGNKTSTLQKQFPGLRHTSGYRNPEHNARVGGAKNSYHMQRDAAGNARANDWVGSPREMQQAAAWAKQNGAKEVLIHNVGSGQHLHVAW